MPVDKMSIFAKVVAGLILAAILAVLAWLRESALQPLAWFWEQSVWFFSHVLRSYPIPGWAIIVFCCLALPSIFKFFSTFRKKPTPSYTTYTEDIFFGAKWRWDWSDGSIANLKCYCPSCDQQLVYDASSCSPYNMSGRKLGTAFLCELCGNREVAFVEGGNLEYAIGAVMRRIDREIRTGNHGK